MDFLVLRLGAEGARATSGRESRRSRVLAQAVSKRLTMRPSDPRLVEPGRLDAALDFFGSLGSVDVVSLPTSAAKTDIDHALSSLNGRRLILLGDDSTLNMVVQRLLRKGMLGEVVLGVLPTARRSPVRSAFGLPADVMAAARIAAREDVTRCGLVRDDHGGVVLGVATLQPWDGSRFGARTYVDDDELTNHRVRRLRIVPCSMLFGSGAVEVEARSAQFRLTHRARKSEGRAVTINCEESRLVIDGAVHPRPQIRRTWWWEPDAWSVALPHRSDAADHRWPNS